MAGFYYGDFDMNLQELWAKTEPFQSVTTHGITVGILAQEIFLKYLAPGNRLLLCKLLGVEQHQITEFIGYWASLHDIGKIECCFQSKHPGMKDKLLSNDLYIPFINGNAIRHEKTGKEILKDLWNTLGAERRARNLFAGIIGAHHQGKSGDAVRQFSAPWHQFHLEFEQSMRQHFMNDTFWMPSVLPDQKGVVCALFLGMLILADWIGSGASFQDAEFVLSQADGNAILEQRADLFLSKNGFLSDPVSWSDRFCGIWPNIPENGKRPAQAEMEHLFQNTNQRIRLLLLEAPMGEGKTEAGMFAALQMQKHWGKNGFYVAMPTAATSNQMVSRMRTLLEMHGLTDTIHLLHAMAWLVDERVPEYLAPHEEEQEIRNWLAPLKRGLLAPYAVGTVDQAMLAATQVKYGVLRLLGLADKVLLIDEIHSYDIYMSEIIIRLLEWCCALEIPVVMLSATLPEEKKRAMLNAYSCPLPSGNYPAITAVQEDGSAIVKTLPPSGRQTRIHMEQQPFLNSPEEVAALAGDAVADGGCICILMNTVDGAQKVYSALSGKFDGTLLLFHARFPVARRDELEQKCIRLFGKDKSHRPSRAILVATQVVEQSLDVDFDGMITSVAPIDLVLQRFGRLHRHENTPRPSSFASARAWILTPEEPAQFGVNGLVYPPCLLNRTIHLLQNREFISLPEDIQPLVQEGYSSASLSGEELTSWLEMMAADSIKAAQGRGILLSRPDKVFSPMQDDPVFGDDSENDYLAIKTRLGDASIRVALVEPEIYKMLQSISVSRNGKLYAAVENRSLAKKILANSVSLPARKISGKLSDLLDIHGDKLIAGLEILPGESGIYRDPCGTEIRFDPNLGVIISESKDGEL